MYKANEQIKEMWDLNHIFGISRAGDMAKIVITKYNDIDIVTIFYLWLFVLSQNIKQWSFLINNHLMTKMLKTNVRTI